MSQETQRQLRLAARALARAGLVHAYGHCSVRVNRTEMLATPPLPLGTVPVGATALTVPICGQLPDGVAGEIRVHQQIYARRADVHAICRVQPPHVVSLSATGAVPLPRHGFGAYLHTTFWDNPRLLRDDNSAARVAEHLGSGNVVVLRGNGAVVVAESLPRAVTLAWYLEDAARIELDVRRGGGDLIARLLTSDEIADRATWDGGIAERMWTYLTAEDAEA